MTDNTDPFAPFRRMFEQFDATGTGDVPPALGFPLSPFPMPGAGTPTLSPEDSTKRTVRQLYGTLAGFSKGSPGGTLVDAWEQYADMFDIDTSLSSTPEQVGAAAMNTYRVWFYSLSQILVESYTLHLVHDELVVPDHRRTTSTQKWLWGLSQAEREQLLLRCTDVEDDLVEAMQTARKHRDKLLYDFGSWSETDVEGSLADARRYLRVLTALDDHATEGSPFSFFPRGVDRSDSRDDPQDELDDSASGKATGHDSGGNPDEDGTTDGS
ncbi:MULTISPECIES: hypothetical protein [Salinibaculum]|uniref:hypothetical protein n=1 Tax=Salinibaculum TaxID=2732368 RepID=UPI0030CCB994